MFKGNRRTLEEVQEQESLALDQLFLCTNGPQWKNKTGWTKEDNKAMLHGVTFNNVHGGITILSLSGNNLAGYLPENFMHLTKLVTLDLSGNVNLSGPIPVSLGLLKTLGMLYLTNTGFTGSIPPQLCELPRLETLGIGYCPNVTGALPEELVNLTRLKTLKLSKSNLSGTVPLRFAEMTRLTDLELSGNVNLYAPTATSNYRSAFFKWMNREGFRHDLDSLAVPEAEVPMVRDYTCLHTVFTSTRGHNWTDKSGWETNEYLGSRLKGVAVKSDERVAELDLRDNNLTGRIPPEIWDMDQLRILLLYGNRLTGDIPEIPENRILSHLSNLDLHGNELTGCIPELSRMPNLIEVRFGYNALTGGIPESVEHCSRLKMLDVASNKITGPIPESLGLLKGLIELRLGHNGLSGIIPPQLGGLPKLEELDLSDCSNLMGPIPTELAKLGKLKILKLHNNNLSGCIPLCFVSLTSLRTLRASGNVNLKKPVEAVYRPSDFFKWLNRLDHDLAEMRTSAAEADGVDHVDRPYSPAIKEQGVLLEAPLTAKVHDFLRFEDYADVIAEHILAPNAWPVGVGIFAKWGAGKSSLLKLILGKLSASGSQRASYWHWCEQFLSRYGLGVLMHALCTRYCCCCKPSQAGDEDAVSSRPAVGSPPKVTCIIASFDAWLFSDSDVLWAVMISEIFQKVEAHHCFGKGAVRASRVRHAVESFACMDWAVALFTVLVLAGLTVIAVVVAREIGDLGNLLVEAIAWLGLAGVPLFLFMCAMKDRRPIGEASLHSKLLNMALPLVFKGQGQQILSEARSMGESVGSAHLGFMAKVRDEMQLLLGMIKAKCTEQEKYVLVVSIDNLDRCPYRQIVKVLEAAHLLLEQEETNVVLLLALDPRVIIAAIEADMDNAMRQEGFHLRACPPAETLPTVSGAEYLDKIIHWPFCIPFGTNNERLDLIGNWLETSWVGSQEGSTSQSTKDAGEFGGIRGGDSALAAISNGRSEPAGANPGRQTEFFARASANATHATDRALDSNFLGDEDVDADPHNEQILTAASEGSRLQPDTRQGLDTIPDQVDDPLREEAIALAAEGGIAMGGGGGEPQERGYQQGSHHNISFPGAAAVATAQVRESDDILPVPKMHTRGELEEFRVLVETVVTTPRKLKRVYNIYSIQRSLAIKIVRNFSQIDARKLLRWTFISEFWPFRASCLVGYIPIAGLPHETLANIYRENVAASIEQMIGKPTYNRLSAAGRGDHLNSQSEAKLPSGGQDVGSSSHAWTAARRHLSMDESDEGIIRFLESAPQLRVQDFLEKNLGLLRLSFNLNPAMVASVSSWTRANWY